MFFFAVSFGPPRLRPSSKPIYAFTLLTKACNIMTFFWQEKVEAELYDLYILLRSKLVHVNQNFYAKIIF